MGSRRSGPTREWLPSFLTSSLFPVILRAQIKHWAKRHFVLTTTTLQYADTRDAVRCKQYLLKDILSTNEVGERKLEV